MTYSFIKPKIKPSLNLFSKIWFLFSFAAIAIIVLVYFLLGLRYIVLNLELNNKKEELISIQEQTTQNEKLFITLTEYNQFSLSIIGKEGSNENLQKSLNNLFDLIIKSGSIRLNELDINESSLNLKGITPTKEMFILLIQTPLKSIFDESYVSFYLLKNGWYSFVNTNKNLDKDKQ